MFCWEHQEDVSKCVLLGQRSFVHIHVFIIYHLANKQNRLHNLLVSGFVCFSQIHCVRQLHHLPELAALQSDLLRVFPLASHSTPQTIAQRLQQIPAGTSAFHL